MLHFNQTKNKYNPAFFPCLKNGEYGVVGEDDVPIKIGKKEYYHYKGFLCPWTKVVDKKIFVDQSRLLLHFILIILENINSKVLDPNLSFFESYLTEEMKTVFTIIDEKLTYYTLRKK